MAAAQSGAAGARKGRQQSRRRGPRIEADGTSTMRLLDIELDILGPAAPPRGRRRIADDPVKRRRHLRCAYYRLVEGRPVRWIASRFRVSKRTVQLWVRAALGYDDPEAEGLRRLLGAA